MQEFQQRVIDEKTELDEKLTKLRRFFVTPIFAGLPQAEQDLLTRQQVVMTSYSNILEARIALFNDEQA